MRRASTEVIPHRRERPEDVALRVRLKSLVAAKGLQLKDIAAVLGVNTSAVGMAYAGQIQVPPAWIPPLSELLETSTTYLRGDWRPRRGGCEKGEKRPRHGPVPKRKNPLKAQADRMLSARLAYLIQINRVKHKELAAHIGVVPKFFATVLHDRAPFPRAWLRSIADYFGMSLDDLVEGIPWREGIR